MGKKGRGSALAAPTQLPSFEPDDADQIVVIVETPKGCRNKYAYDEKERVFRLKRVLPAGMGFPYDFGFIPSTRAEDGDPLDALVLMDGPAFTGCRLSCRPVGIIEGEEGDKGEATRNDRIVCVEQGNHAFTHVKRVEDLGAAFEREIEEFFVNYHKLSGKKYRVLGIKGTAQARKRIKACRNRHR
jgi:inorganic pyrophosphatase